ncbi:MAG: ABC transporter ATP-binding protein [Chthoniobacterales bacterium]|nr:ABC transporter ATP-binding protein [Chthoniobacterales bacterium]
MTGSSILTPLRKIWRILAPRERRQSIVIFLLMLVGMVLETLGIGLVIPALALMTQSDVKASVPALAPWIESLGPISNSQIVIAGMLALVGAYAVKTAFLAYLAWKQTRFIYGVQTNLSQRLFMGYLAQPYSFHLQRNSAQLVRNSTQEVKIFAHNGFSSVMVLLTEVLVIIGVFALLICVEPVGALVVVALLGTGALGVNALLKKRVVLWGDRRLYHEGVQMQYLMEGLGGVKDVKLLGCEAEFGHMFQTHCEAAGVVGRRQSTLLVMPRLVLELFAVVGIAILVIVMVFQGRSPEALLPTLGVFAAAAFRIMPSFSRIMMSLQSIQFALPVVDTLYSELLQVEVPVTDSAFVPLAFERAITLEKVGFQYEGAASHALEDISLSITKGSSVGFIGGSGAGKSTLVDILIGLLFPTEGTVTLDGVSIQGNLRGWQDKIGYVPQAIFLKDDTLRRNVAFGIPEEKIDQSAVERAIVSARLDDFIATLPEGLATKVGERGVRLSGGQRQRIGIARALYHNPEVLVLDEATSSLDVDTESDVMEAVNALHGQKTLIIIAHRMSTVEQCDRLFRLDAGRLVAEGSASEMLRKGDEKPSNLPENPLLEKTGTD